MMPSITVHNAKLQYDYMGLCVTLERGTYIPPVNDPSVARFPNKDYPNAVWFYFDSLSYITLPNGKKASKNTRLEIQRDRDKYMGTFTMYLPEPRRPLW